MTIDFYSTSPDDGLFNILGKVFYAQGVLNTARETTVPTEVNDVFTAFNLLAADAQRDAIIASLPSAVLGWQSSGSGLIGALRSFAQSLLIDMVDRDAPLPQKSLDHALAELLSQMAANSKTVDASTVTVAVAAGGSNQGDGVIVLSKRRGDGLVQEHALAETIDVTAAGASSLRFVAARAAGLLDGSWPDGSGCNTSLPVTSPDSSLVSNGNMDAEDDTDNAPDDWSVAVGTIGTTLKMTNLEEQTIAISGTPTGGSYPLYFTNADAQVQETDQLDYNASGAAVQAALRELIGLENVTVTGTTGTSPNYTHTVRFDGLGGNVAALTSSTTNLTGGTPVITHATTVAGTAQVYRGEKAVEFDSNGSQLTTLQQRVTGLAAQTAYAVSLRAIADVIPAAGKITIDLVDGLGGSVVRDAQGMLNSISFAAAGLLTTWQHIASVVAAVNEVQTLTITGTPAGGDFTLTFDGQATAAIAFDANSAAVQSALVALSNVETGDITCGGGALPGTPVTITFGGRYAGRAMPLITANGAGLTGGSSPTATVALTTIGSAAEPVFRLPEVLPAIVYLRVRISTAVSSGTSVFLDDVAMTRMTALYKGGPLAAVFAGADAFVAGDEFTVTVTNDRAGLIQEWMNRNFDMATKGLLLPSNAIGGENILDSVVA